VIPIATKVHHTYANVSEAVQAKSDGSVESSFRPGEDARLSSVVDSNAGSADAVKRDGELDDANSGSAEAECWSSSSLHSVSLSSSLASLSSRSSLPASASTPSCGSATTPLPPPPLPPLSSVDGRGLSKKNLPPVPKRGVKQPGGFWMRSGSSAEGRHGDVLPEAVSIHRSSVDRADKGDYVAETRDDQIQRNEPLCRLPHRAGLMRDGGTHMMVAPLKVIRENSQVPRISKRSFSVDAAAQGNAADGNTSTSAGGNSENADCGFLYLAERARQEYIKRRASVVGCEQQPSRTSTTNPPAAVVGHKTPIAVGTFKDAIARKAAELQRNRVAVANDELAANRCDRSSSKNAVLAVNTNRKMTTGFTGQDRPCLRRGFTSNERRPIPQFINRIVNHSHYGAHTLPNPRNHGRSAASSGRTSVSSEYSVPELEPRINELVILPPPPDFVSCNGENLPSVETVSSSTLSADEVSALEKVLPPPPHEFSDGPDPTGDFRCRPIASWSVSDVAQWLDSLEMGNYRDSFVAHSVDGRQLVELGRAELIALGVSQVGHRMNLERAIKRAIISMPTG